MSCPDEDTFARFVQGLLPPDAASDVEQHVDGCARCADLAAAFGSLYAEPAPAATEAARPETWALMAAAVMHVAWTVVLRIWPAALDALPRAPLTTAYALYAAMWAPAGGGVALLAALGLARRRPWGRATALCHAMLSLPSIILTPLAMFVIAIMRRPRRDNGKRPAS
jgi:anti-sigma factor RsiW